MSGFEAWKDGFGRLQRAPVLVVGVWLATLAIALPLTLVLRSMLADGLGHSMAAESALSGTNNDWMEEFADQASGIGVTFRPAIIGFAAVLDNASAFADNTARPLVIAGAASAYLLVWLFLAGGMLDRLARDRRIGANGFFAACGVFFFRFLRLGVIQWIGYGVLFGALHPLLFDQLYPRFTHDLTVERTAFFIRFALYIVFGVALAALNLVFDYAKVRAVVEDRRSMIGALAAGVRFVTRNRAAAGVYALNVLAFVGCVAVYALIAPGAEGAGLSLVMAVAIAQFYVIARLIVKLWFWSAETALFQSRLAHAGYVAAVAPEWPDSPAAEAITRSTLG